MVILSLVGKEMRHMVGVAGRMFSTLAEGNINIEMISQGANEINISCVLHECVASKVRERHTWLTLGFEPDSLFDLRTLP